MKKRVRESSSAEEEEDGGDARAPEKANEFGQWLLENIYKYAEVRDSEELAKLRKEHEELKRDRNELRLLFSETIEETGYYEQCTWFCGNCGDTHVYHERRKCGRCRSRYAPCNACVPAACASGRHLLCQYCEEDDEEEDIPNCVSELPDICSD